MPNVLFVVLDDTGFGHLACLTNGSTGFPGSDGYLPFKNSYLPEILLQQGYNTYAVGEWHLAPEETMSAAGLYDRWPLVHLS
jgi:arylsulfatase